MTSLVFRARVTELLTVPHWPISIPLARTKKRRREGGSKGMGGKRRGGWRNNRKEGMEKENFQAEAQAQRKGHTPKAPFSHGVGGLHK